MLHENIPAAANPERLPMAPHDPPEPAPQAAAWRRAMQVVGCLPVGNELRMVRGTQRRATRHRC
jgi:hypothetical protein